MGPRNSCPSTSNPAAPRPPGSAVGFSLTSCDDRLETTLTCRRRHRTPWSLSTYSQQLLQTCPLQKNGGAPPPLPQQLAFWLLVAMSCIRNSQVTAATWGGVGRSHLGSTPAAHCFFLVLSPFTSHIQRGVSSKDLKIKASHAPAGPVARSTGRQQCQGRGERWFLSR